MTAKAHGMRYRPLLSGIEIRNPNGAAPGTLGCIAVSNDNERWLVSCFHVLHGMDQAAPVDNQAIYQPTTDEDENIVAHTDSNRISAELDNQIDHSIEVAINTPFPNPEKLEDGFWVD